jgi:hypothetical protein
MSRFDETSFRHRFLDELEVNPKNGLDASLPTCPLKRSVGGSAFGTQAGHRFVVAFCSIDNAACVIAVCRPCSVVNTLKELSTPSWDASGKYYLLDSFLFKMVRRRYADLLFNKILFICFYKIYSKEFHLLLTSAK